jgi:hypothetical protein
MDTYPGAKTSGDELAGSSWGQSRGVQSLDVEQMPTIHYLLDKPLKLRLYVRNG